MYGKDSTEEREHVHEELRLTGGSAGASPAAVAHVLQVGRLALDLIALLIEDLLQVTSATRRE